MLKEGCKTVIRTTTSECRIDIAATGPLAPTDVLEGQTDFDSRQAQGGWHRLMADLFADQKLETAKRALHQAAARTDLRAASNLALTKQMLACLRTA